MTSKPAPVQQKEQPQGEKNCHTCEHITTTATGYGCTKRDQDGEDQYVLNRLQFEPYRNRWKRCYEPKGVA
jgi:hypothetical protein